MRLLSLPYERSRNSLMVLSLAHLPVPVTLVSSHGHSTESQPIDIDKSQQLTQRLSSRKALVIAASQVTAPPTFELQLRRSQPEVTIVALTEGSSAATAAITKEDKDGNESGKKRIDERFADNSDGIDWSYVPLYCKPVATQKQRKSWVHRYSYRVVLIKDPDHLFFACCYCHQHK
jgi:hypothetical protein